MNEDEGFSLGARETLAGVLITTSVSTFIFKTNLPFTNLISEHELTVWALGGVVTAMAFMVLWVRQTNKNMGQS